MNKVTNIEAESLRDFRPNLDALKNARNLPEPPPPMTLETKERLKSIGLDFDAPGFKASSYITYDNSPPLLKFTYSEKTYPLAYSGTLVCLSGRAKTCKTELLCNIAAQALSPEAEPLGVIVEPIRQNEYVLWIDTEQPQRKYAMTVTKICKYAGLKYGGDGKVSIPEQLLPVNFRALDIGYGDRLNLIEDILQGLQSKNARAKYLVLDGIAELVANVNDPAESVYVIEKMKTLTGKYKTTILTVLHDNEKSGSQGTPRGHLGSQAIRAFDVVLRMAKEQDDSFSLDVPTTRYTGGLPTYSFYYDEAEHLLRVSGELPPGSRASNNRKPTQTELLKQLVALDDEALKQEVCNIVSGARRIGPADLRGRISDATGINSRAIQGDLIHELQIRGFIEKDGNANQSPFNVLIDNQLFK